MPDRMTEADWQRVTLYAAPQAIEARLKTARRALREAQRTVDRWGDLLALRLGQVDAGTWPPPVERVTWRELRAGDVLLDDPDREVLVEVAETKWTRADGEWTTVWFQVPAVHGLSSRSAPAGREVTVRPRTAARGGDHA
jgi:hypothetical protein